MPKRYTFEDVNTDELPRITPGKFKFGIAVYGYKCQGRGSVGYGTTPKHAWNSWERNWKRRFRFYGDQEERAKKIIEMYELKLVRGGK